jgi:hypothetical protein
MDEVTHVSDYPLNERHRRVVLYLLDSLDRLYAGSSSIDHASQWCRDEAIPNITQMRDRCMTRQRSQGKRPYVDIIRWYTSKIEDAPGDHLKGHGRVLWETIDLDIKEVERAAVRAGCVGRPAVRAGCVGRPAVRTGCAGCVGRAARD